MQHPRIKIFTRSFNLKLYRLAEGLFSGWNDAWGSPVPCVRVTDKSALGYFRAILADDTCDIAISIEEDCFVTDPGAVLALAGEVLDGGYACAGCSDGSQATTGRDPVAMSPFFTILNLTLIRTKADSVEIAPGRGDAEPYYALFHWLADSFPVLYLPGRKHSDTLTTEVLDAQGHVICLHSWLSRFYNVPTCIVKLFEPERVRQKARIDAIIREAYGLRKKAVPEFGTAEKLAIAGDRFIRWCIKIPQRIAGWPRKLLRR
jgi:hypothetical protein